jgi:hypothetical protein
MSDLVMNNLYTGFTKEKKQCSINLGFILRYNFIQTGSESYELPSYSLMKRPITSAILCMMFATLQLQVIFQT